MKYLCWNKTFHVITSVKNLCKNRTKSAWFWIMSPPVWVISTLTQQRSADSQFLWIHFLMCSAQQLSWENSTHSRTFDHWISIHTPWLIESCSNLFKYSPVWELRNMLADGATTYLQIVKAVKFKNYPYKAFVTIFCDDPSLLSGSNSTFLEWSTAMCSHTAVLWGYILI